MVDTRIVYGARCFWWDSIDKVGLTPPMVGERTGKAIQLPCCPHCSSVLMEVPDEASWWRGVDDHEQKAHAGYREFIKWSRGKRFKGTGPAYRAYHAETGKTVGGLTL